MCLAARCNRASSSTLGVLVPRITKPVSNCWRSLPASDRYFQVFSGVELSTPRGSFTSCCLGTRRDCSLGSTKVEFIHRCHTVSWVRRPSPTTSVEGDHTLEEFDFFLTTKSRHTRRIDSELVFQLFIYLESRASARSLAKKSSPSTIMATSINPFAVNEHWRNNHFCKRSSQPAPR